MATINGKNLWAPAVVGVAPEAINLAIALGTLFIVSKIPTLIPQALFNIKPSPWGQAMSQNVAALQKSAMGPMNLGGRMFAGKLNDITADKYNYIKNREARNGPLIARERAEVGTQGAQLLSKFASYLFPSIQPQKFNK